MTDWITKQRKLLNTTSLEIEPMKHINIHLCYVNSTGEISELKTVKHDAINISEPDMYKLVQDYKKPAYSFVEMSSFIAQKFETPEFKTYPMVSKIEIPESLFIYHGLNCLLFLYREKANGNKITKRVRFAPTKGTRKHSV